MEAESPTPMMLTRNITDANSDKWQSDGAEGWSSRDAESADDRKWATPRNHSHELYATGHLLEQVPIVVLTYGYVSPALVLVTVLTNSMVCVVLLKKEIRTATNCLLVAMAISDMLTGLLPLPCFLYFYTAGHYREWVPYKWCFIYLCMTDYLPTVTHTASIWLTVALASQRFICVRHSFKAKKLCTIGNIIKVIGAIYVLAFLSHCNRFAELQFDPVTVRSRIEPQRSVTSCRYDFSPFVMGHMHVYFNVYFWYRVVFIHLVPCLSLVVLNTILVWTMREAQLKRHILQNRSECRRLIESNATTLMLVVVVGLLLLVELPLAVLFVVMILENTLSIAIVREETTKLSTLVVNLVILLSYPLNFFIYCGMSRQFRDTFQGLFRRRRGHVHHLHHCEALERSTAPETSGSFAISGASRRNNCSCNRNMPKSFLKTTTV